MEVIKEMERKNSHEAQVEGDHTATKAGTYVFTWDNTYSMWTKKPLKYLVCLHHIYPHVSHKLTLNQDYYLATYPRRRRR